jgi:hypothetical protein
MSTSERVETEEKVLLAGSALGRDFGEFQKKELHRELN